MSAGCRVSKCRFRFESLSASLDSFKITTFTGKKRPLADTEQLNVDMLITKFTGKKRPLADTEQLNVDLLITKFTGKKRPLADTDS